MLLTWCYLLAQHSKLLVAVEKLLKTPSGVTGWRELPRRFGDVGKGTLQSGAGPFWSMGAPLLLHHTKQREVCGM